VAPAVTRGPQPARVRTERGLDRFITFLDAVVAIAITLLVLPLVDVLGGGGPRADLGTVLAEGAGRLGGLSLSFAVIARLWLAHHRLVEGVGGYDRAFVQLDLLWILTIVLLPFATPVVSTHPPEPLSVGIYVGTVT
jgi:uncharacterized membrane protein